MTCPKKYDYHYNQRLRPKISSAALLFGTAVDTAIQCVLKNEAGKDPNSVFTYCWSFAEINGEKTYLPDCIDIAYSNSDADKDLISIEHREKLLMTYGPEWEEKISAVIRRKDAVGFKYLSLDEKKLFNFYNWTCLHAKGLLMIEAVKKKILPKIEKVLSVQEYVNLQNDNGDEVVGYVDLVCKFENIDKPVIFDFKTSSIDYEKDSVLTSPQLTLYVHSLSDKYENTRNAGFIVLHKRVIKNKKKVCASCGYDGSGQRHKTCNNLVDNDVQGDGKYERCDGIWTETIDPEIKIQIITDEIPVQTENVVLENMDMINECIKNGVFIRNFDSCQKPWGPCPYIKKCFHNSDEDLIKK